MKLRLTTIALSLTLSAQGALACASCGCSLNTDIGYQGMGSNPGWTADIRYDYLDQNQLRSATNSISSSNAVGIVNSKTGQLAEVEGFTKNNYLTATLDYNNGDSWGASLVLPLIQRQHLTYGSDASGGGGLEGWPSGANGYQSKTTGLGDIKLIGRYFGFSEQKNWGLQIGVKLPTGNNAQTAPASTAALALGTSVVAVDPGLQLGTGSTDLIIGAYKYGHIFNIEDWGYFGNVQFQSVIDPKSTPTNIDALGQGGSYRQGNGLNINVGLNYQGLENWTPTVQLNFIDKKTDSGTAADTWSTGGTIAYLTPGLLYTASNSVQVYSNIQVPIYQHLNGIQLTPNFVASMGVRLHF